jgi:hypothetical protein
LSPGRGTTHYNTAVALLLKGDAPAALKEMEQETIYANSTHQYGNGGHRWKQWTEKWAPFPKLLETAARKSPS